MSKMILAVLGMILAVGVRAQADNASGGPSTTQKVESTVKKDWKKTSNAVKKNAKGTKQSVEHGFKHQNPSSTNVKTPPK